MSSTEQSEDQPADEEATEADAPEADAPEVDAPEADGATEPDAGEPDAGEDDAGEDEAEEDRPPTEDERLEQLTDRIEKVRAKAEDDGVLVDEDRKTYVESGATHDEDDQTITPPG